jgi:hypothetical protein
MSCITIAHRQRGSIFSSLSRWYVDPRISRSPAYGGKADCGYKWSYMISVTVSFFENK